MGNGLINYDTFAIDIYWKKDGHKIHYKKIPFSLLKINLFVEVHKYSFFFSKKFILVVWDLSCDMWEDLVPWPRIEPRPPSLAVLSLSHWTTREIPYFLFIIAQTTKQLYLLVAEVQDVGKFLHLLETEVFLPLKSVIEHTQLGLREHSSNLLFLDRNRLFLLCALLHRRGQWFHSGACGRIRTVLNKQIHGGGKRRDCWE